MGLTTATASAEPENPTPGGVQTAPATDVRTMTDRELGNELARIGGEKTLREQEIVNEMKSRGQQFLEAAPPTSGIGVSGDIPVRKGVSITGTVAVDPRNDHVITGGGVKVGKPGAPQFTGITPRPDGLNVEANGTAKIGESAEVSDRLTLNVAPDLTVSGSYHFKGKVTMPDGRSFEVEVVIERRPDGTWNTKLPDGITTTTPLPGGGTAGTKLPGDPNAAPSDPVLKGPKPGGPKKPGKSGSTFDLSAAITLDKEFTPNPGPPPTAEEVQRALRDYTRAQREQRARTENWMAQNRQEALRRQAEESAKQRAAAAEAARRAALPDRDRDQIPDQEDATPNQNDTDPTSTDVGDGPEGNPGYGSDEATSPPRSQPPASSDPKADFDRDGIPDSRDGTWNQNDTDPASTDVGDGPEGNAGYGGSGSSSATATSPGVSLGGSGAPSSSTVDKDHDGISDATDSTPNQNDTDPASTDVGDGPEGNAGYGGSDSSSSTGSSTSSSSDTSSPTGSDSSSSSDVDTDHDGISDASDSTPNQNDTDPASTDVGDGPEGNAGYGDSGSDSGSGLCC